MPQFDDRPRRKKRRKIPKSRVYIHIECGQATEVGEDSFRDLCDPYFQPPALSIGGLVTFCAYCRDYDFLEEFYWEDTDELLTDFRKRVFKLMPFWYKWFRSGGGCFVGGSLATRS